ncbi:putative quinol monooxygenase [Streptomyces sp. NPDC006632]|uniref:putative quinol monooxygenase n=1 Tax=unclassified Streptomyces TaxID=2593676 RepID=UPI002E24C4B7
MTLQITVLFDVLPDRIDSIAPAFAELAEHTRREAGALRFDAFLSESRENTVVLIEEWTDQDAIDQHMKQPYTQDFLDRSTGAFARPAEVHRMRLLDGAGAGR